MLSATAINNAKPKDKPYKLADEKGLYLFIQATGSKLWRFDYRFLDKRKTLALGHILMYHYPMPETKETKQEAYWQAIHLLTRTKIVKLKNHQNY